MTDEPAAVWAKIDELHAWPENPKKVTEQQVSRLARTINRFGFGSPITARKANCEIIAGHRRWRAAKRLKLTHVPVRFLDVTEDEAHKMAIADQRAADESKWDNDALAGMVEDWRDDGEDLDELGFSEAETSKLLGENYESVVEEMAVEAAQAEFFMSIHGPLTVQPEVLDRLKEALAGIEGVEVTITTTEL